VAEREPTDIAGAGENSGTRTATSELPESVPDELDPRLLRALADLDNLRKRYARELARERRAERSLVAAEWLPVVDDLERALVYADEHGDPLTEGLRAVYEHALAVLERLGFPRFEDTGRLFDPVRHESVGVIESDEPPGTVTAVMRPGYGTDDEILRPAAVIVARNSE
jgi:molecular chaperone GrpE